MLNQLYRFPYAPLLPPFVSVLLSQFTKEEVYYVLFSLLMDEDHLLHTSVASETALFHF